MNDELLDSIPIFSDSSDEGSTIINEDDMQVIIPDYLLESSAESPESNEEVLVALADISSQIQTLNENVCTLNDNVIIGVGFLFVLVVYFVIQGVIHIMNRVLGLGSC